MRTININEIEFTLSCQYEDAINIEDVFEIPEVQDNIREQVLLNDWAWCTVEVRGVYKGIEATTYLGACSYESEEDFINNSGYYEDMKNEVYEEIITKLKGLYEAIKE